MIVLRVLAASICLFYLIPSEIIEALGVRTIVNSLFMSTCGAFFTYGIWKFRMPRGLSVFEKALGVFGVLVAGMLALGSVIQGNFFPEGYKFVVIFLMIFVGSELSRGLLATTVIRDILFLLGGYVALILIFLLVTGADQLLRPVGAGEVYTRLDITGSVTAMSVAATIATLLALIALIDSKSWLAKAWYAFIVLAGVYLLLLAASRQALLIILLFALINFFTGDWRAQGAIVRRLSIIGLSIAAFAAFVIYSLYVNESFYLRLLNNPSGDYTSGRFNSIALWLEEMRINGGPLGFGYIKNNAVLEIELLWPHNEFIRFYLESGIPGVALISLMVVYAATALKIALHEKCDFLVRECGIVFFSVMTVQLLLENFIHNIFLSTLCFLLLSLAAHNSLSVRKAESAC